MARNKALTAGSPEEIEAAFYEAMNRADVDALMRCWADEDDIVCVHPGGPRFLGAGAIRSSFEQIFHSSGAIRASIHKVRRVQTLNTAMHNLIEKVQVGTEQEPAEAYVITTHVFIKTPQGWRMVVHHASPGTPRELAELSDAPAVLH
jgi:ketosteroid isomerase-like protein